jgi:hypothetical protein
MVVEKLDHCAGIGDMLFHAHTKRFHTLKYVEGACRALAGSENLSVLPFERER